MARAGLGDGWRCLLANDIDTAKCAAYAANFGREDLVEGDIASLTLEDLPTETADLLWGSFPCQDLSLAGARGGMSAKRSGAFFPFWLLAEQLNAAGRGPKIIAIENVVGLLTSNGGRDFAGIIERMAHAGYAVTASVVDAKRFTPQSRPRLFIMGFAPGLRPPVTVLPPADDTAPPALISAFENLPPATRARWVWLSPSPAFGRNIRLADIIDWDAPEWHEAEYTKALIDMMSPKQRRRIDALLGAGARRVGTAFRRTRTENGKSIQRVEARFDGIAGCLRTPAGGSSRQIVFAIDSGAVRSRLLSPREAARLMGLPEHYILPDNTTAALKLAGDGVCVPAVRWLAENVFEPALSTGHARRAA